MTKHPKTVTVSIGVSGHRILAEIDKVSTAIDEALQTLAAEFDGRPLRMISCLAEGADRLVVERAFSVLGAGLLVLLPLDSKTYMGDFRTAKSRREYLGLLDRASEIVQLPAARNHNEAYKNAGRILVERSDAVIAVWDGRPPQGIGGTGDIVAQARLSRLPIAWIHAGNRRPGTDEPTTLGNEQGRLTYENMEAHDIVCDRSKSPRRQTKNRTGDGREDQ